MFKVQAKWPIVGLAWQKNYISLYTSVVKDGAPITDRYKGSLRRGQGIGHPDGGSSGC
jgi:hypothetical protein